jgi:proteasome lid subunit RPN8/RPN11
MHGGVLGRVEIRAAVFRALRKAAQDCHGGFETGGLLGGVAGGDERAVDVSVQCALFTESADRSLLHFAFDLDSVDKARAKIKAQGLVVVGWFHVHPAGVPHMSSIDVDMHRSNFSQEWQLSVVGSVADGVGPLVGIWHAHEGELSEVLEYAVLVASGLDDDRQSAIARASRDVNLGAESWDPRLLAVAVELATGNDTLGNLVQQLDPTSSAAENWYSVFDRALSAEPPGRADHTASRVMRRVGLVDGGTSLRPHIVTLSGESDVRTSKLFAVDGSRSWLWQVDLADREWKRVRTDVTLSPLVDVAFDGDTVWLLTSQGELLTIGGFADRARDLPLTLNVAGVLNVGDDPALRACPGSCLVSWRPTFEGTSRLMFQIVSVDGRGMQPQPLDAGAIGVWDDQFVSVDSRLGQRFVVRDTDGQELAGWDVPEGLRSLTIREVAGSGRRVVVVCEDADRDIGVVIEADADRAFPHSMWLRGRAQTLGHAYPVSAEGTKVLHVDRTSVQLLYPGCGGL